MVNAQLNDVRAGTQGMSGHAASGRRADELAAPPNGSSNLTFWLRIRFTFGAPTCPISLAAINVRAMGGENSESTRIP